MGFLKKITRPISKFLDKIVPNELKPALPYLSAMAPFMMSPTGIMGSTMMRRALMSGALNLGSQLAQEGSEGEFDPLSLALASGIGAFSAPGTADTVYGVGRETIPGTPGAAEFLETQAAGMDPGWMKSGTEMLGTGAEYLTGAGETLRTNPFSVEGLKAAIVPASQGTADLARITAEQALRDLEDEALETGIGVNDDGRRIAIRSAMEAAGHLEDDILDALASLGLKEGGSVGLKHGGQLVKRGPGRPGYGGKKYHGVGDEKEEWLALRSSYMSDGWTMGEAGQMATDDLGYHIRDLKAQGGRIGAMGGGIMHAKRGLVNAPGGYAGVIAAPLRNKIEGFDKTMLDEYLQGNLPEYKGELVSDRYNRPNFTDVSAVVKIIEMGGSNDDVRRILGNEDISDEDIENYVIWAKRDRERKPEMLKAQGGRINKEGGGISSVLPKGKEADYRGGGVIPIGSRERADDVPARLSKNEFVMTADAVRAAGGGSINKGAKRMYNLMHNLEARV